MISKAKFEEVQKRLEGTRLKAEFFEEDDFVVITAPAGREERKGAFSDEVDLEKFLSGPIDKLNLVGPYAAVASYEEGWVEAIIEPSVPIGANLNQYHRTLFGVNFSEEKAPTPVVLTSGTTTVRIQPASNFLQNYSEFFGVLVNSLLTGEPRILPSIRVESISISTNDAATALLERIANAIFFQIDLLKGIPLELRRIRERRPTYSFRKKGKNLHDLLEFPKHDYDSEALAYFWAARGARNTPHFQFLSYYHVIEYYFRTFAKRASVERLQNILRDPTFRSDKQLHVARLIEASETTDKLSERDQLRLTLTSCADESALREWLEKSPERKEFLTTKKGNKVSETLIPIKEASGGCLPACAKRIYDIRCKIVHSSATSKEEGAGSILPLSRFENALFFDIELVEFFAVKVIVANATPLKL